jgi:outer membrane protein OmpA-like peptidoglycan-associated protein
MKRNLMILLVATLFSVVPVLLFAEMSKEKEHDFIPKVHNLIFLVDVSDSMTSGYPKSFDHPRVFVASRALQLFNDMMPHVSRWQHDLNTALITFGDNGTPRILSPLGPWVRVKYAPFYNCLRQEEGWGPYRTAALQDALQLAGSLMTSAVGRTAIVIISDGGSAGECPQKTATALKDEYGDRVRVYSIFLGNMEVGWRNLYETCKLAGGYARHWEDVRSCQQMKDFSWDVTVREIMFPYPEIFFKPKSAELIPSEALKLEAVANFLHAIPQYVLQIDGHTTFLGNTPDNYKMGLERARSVKDALVRIYCVHPDRIRIRSWGEELPRYDNQNPDTRVRNRQAVLYLMLPLRNFPYDEKRLHTFGVDAVGDIYNTQMRDADEEWAWPDKPIPGSGRPTTDFMKEFRQK